VTATSVATTRLSRGQEQEHVPGHRVLDPGPFGLIRFFKDHPINQLGHDPMFDPKSTAFNPWPCGRHLYPPIFYEIKKRRRRPTMSSSRRQNQLIVDLGGSKVLIPEQDLVWHDERLSTWESFCGFHVGVMGFFSMTSLLTGQHCGISRERLDRATEHELLRQHRTVRRRLASRRRSAMPAG